MKDRLKERMDNAQEAEADPDRHRMEEAILATLATAAWDQDEIAHAARTVAWSRSDFGAIAAALIESVTEGKVPDLVVIADKLRTAGARIKEAILTGIMEGEKAKDVSVALDYIRIIHLQDKRHAAEAFGRDYLKAVKEGDTDAAFADLAGKVFSLATERKLVRSYPVEADAAEGFLEELNARRSDGRDFIGLETGFRHLDEILNGLKTGVIILAAMPSLGKTTLAKQIADHVAVKEKVPVLFYSFEQSAEELRIKSYARMASVDSRVIEKGRTNDGTWSRIEEAERSYRQGPGPYLRIIEGGRTDTVEAIRAGALMAKRKAGTERILLVIDYLQIIPAGGNMKDIRERIDMILTDLRRLSRDLKSPVLVISSMNRGAYKKGKDGISRPSMTSLKESGGIEYSADVVICLWKDKKESETLTRDLSMTTDRIEALILKNRNGEQNKRVKMNFTKAWSMFDEEGRAADLEADEDE